MRCQLSTLNQTYQAYQYERQKLAVSRPLHRIKNNISYKETHVSAVDPFIVGEINYEETNE